MRRLLIPSPVGPLLVEYAAEGVRALRFWRHGAHPPPGSRDTAERGDTLGTRIMAEVREYFAEGRHVFSLPLSLQGTSFQRSVWEALSSIPSGETRTYSEVAAAIGNPRAARAVGQANRVNRLPLLVPCHRVIAAGGGLGGYVGSGPDARVDIKRWLLAHEGATLMTTDRG